MNEQYQIGIAIVHCITQRDIDGHKISAGFEIAYKVGNQQLEASDTRDVFGQIEVVDKSKIIRMVKITTDGWILCSMKEPPGRQDEYRACWLYFPNSLKISTSEINNIREKVEQAIYSNEYDKSILEDIAHRYTQTIESPLNIISINQQKFAIRYVDDGNPSLRDVFDRIYQKTFSGYEWVILMPKNDVRIKNEIDDITPQPLISSKIIQPIKDEKHGFKPFIGNEVFSKPVRISDNEPLSIIWKQDGFIDIPKSGNRSEDFIIDEKEISRIVRPRQIKFVDENGLTLSLSHGSLSFTSGKWDSRKCFWIVPEQNIANVEIKIDAKGYESSPSKKIDLSSKGVNDVIVITLKEKWYEYKFRICIYWNPNIYTPDFSVKFKERQISCPFQGYKVQSGNGLLSEDALNTLIIDEKFYRDRYSVTQTYNVMGRNRNDNNVILDEKMQQKPKETFWDRWGNVILSCLIGFVIIAICLGLYWIFFQEESVSSQNDTPEPPKAEQVQTATQVDPKPKAKDYSEAIKYLEEKAKFKRDEMESTVGLAGLWDMLNTYNFQAIKDFANQNPELKESKRFCNILNIIQKNPQIPGKYCRDNDFEITISGYENKLNNSLNTRPSNNEPAQVPAGNSGTDTSKENNSQTSNQ